LPVQQTTTRETITATMSRWAAGLEYKQLSQDAIYQAKRFLLDSVGCALGGYQQHDVIIALEVLKEIAGRGPATVIGTGEKMDAVSASLANALMIRCMDYNDIYWKQDPSHPSDIFPAAMACCERAKGDGEELIVGFVLGHEFEMRLCEAAFPGIRERGWHHATLTAFVSPIVAGRALHLSWEKIQHAIGISASRHCTMGAVTAGKLTMMKNTVDPLATQSGVLAALLLINLLLLKESPSELGLEATELGLDATAWRSRGPSADAAPCGTATKAANAAATIAILGVLLKGHGP